MTKQEEIQLMLEDIDYSKRPAQYVAEAIVSIPCPSCEKLKKELEIERIRLAACGVAAMENTHESVGKRIKSDNKYYSASYKDVCNAVDREIKLREELKKKEEEG